jgi:hypothetical protein
MMRRLDLIILDKIGTEVSIFDEGGRIAFLFVDQKCLIVKQTRERITRRRNRCVFIYTFI